MNKDKWRLDEARAMMTGTEFEQGHDSPSAQAARERYSKLSVTNIKRTVGRVLLAVGILAGGGMVALNFWPK